MLGYQGIYIYDPGETDDMLRFALDERTRIRAAVHLQNIDLDKCIYMANEIVQQVLGMKDMAAEVNRISGHDLCTWTHSVDVYTYAVMCGIAMRYNDSELKELSQAALLHDIGKTMVNLLILNKPGKLNDDEFRIIKTIPNTDGISSGNIPPCLPPYVHLYMSTMKTRTAAGIQGVFPVTRSTATQRSYMLPMFMKHVRP